MITRLRVRGFKNLVDLDVRFGPLTCIAGLNGVGKSNLFDALHFLSLLSDHAVTEAAHRLRGGEDVQSLFTGGRGREMSFEADVLVPPRDIDDFGQEIQADHTLLRYRLVLRLEDDPLRRTPIRIWDEHLARLPPTELQIGHDAEGPWQESLLMGDEQAEPLIHNLDHGEDAWIQMHRGAATPTHFLARTLTRTALSSALRLSDTATALLVRQELRRCRVLQLAPLELRRPDVLGAPEALGAQGEHLPAALLRIASRAEDPQRVYAEVANRLAQLVEGVRALRVERDERRGLTRLLLRDRSGQELPAQALSDGTLRLIALAVLEADPEVTGLIGLEEPENGIHPQRLHHVLDLLYGIAVDVSASTGLDNPLRQVIFTTHSPLLAARVRPDDLLFAHTAPCMVHGQRIQSLQMEPLEGTWRAAAGAQTAARGHVLEFLAGRGYEETERPTVEDALNEELTDLRAMGRP